MAELKERLRTDLSAAMRARDNVRMRTLRMALTAITNEEVAGNAARELSDDEVLKVLAKEAKKRREAADSVRLGAAGPSKRPRNRPRARCWPVTCPLSLAMKSSRVSWPRSSPRRARPACRPWGRS